MRRLLVFLAILGLLSSVPFVSFSKDLKIGYVDIFEIFNEYEKTKDYDAVLEKKKDKEKTKLDASKEKIQKMQNKLSLLKDEEQEKQAEKIEDAIRDFKKEERKIYIDLKKERDEKMKEIVTDINDTIEDYAKKNNLDLVVNANAILYGAKAMDLTETILKIVNKTYKK